MGPIFSMRKMFDLFVPINVAVKIERRISNAMGGDTPRDSQNANDHMPLPKARTQKIVTPTPKPQPINQWRFIHWRFV